MIMAEEKIFTIPLRDAHGRGTRKHRSKKAMAVIKKYLKKHTKTEDVKIGKSINEKIWENGIQNIPRKIRVHVLKEADAIYSELVGVDIILPTKEDIEKKETKLMDKLNTKMGIFKVLPVLEIFNDQAPPLEDFTHHK